MLFRLGFWAAGNQEIDGCSSQEDDAVQSNQNGLHCNGRPKDGQQQHHEQNDKKKVNPFDPVRQCLVHLLLDTERDDSLQELGKHGYSQMAFCNKERENLNKP